MNPFIQKLHPYPFEKLAQLIADIVPNPALKPIKLTIGEPQHAAPQFVLDSLTNNLLGVSKYPLTKGDPQLSDAIAAWCQKRFALTQIDAKTQVIPVTGTREALFAITQALVDSQKDELVISPNPFYQIYEGAAFLAGATPYYLPCLAEKAYKIDYQSVPDSIWQRCRLLFVCSPNNPNGVVTTLDEYRYLLQKAQQFEFTIVADECYSEIYFDESQPPLGLLEACQHLDNPSFEHCLVFHSLSKRSNLPGLRSGFVAGDAKILKDFLLYRTYHGCAMPPHHQAASIEAWQDEQHVADNRRRYRQKFDEVLAILQPVMAVSKPEAGFYLWPQTPIDDEQFCRQLYEAEAVLVLPGRYIARDVAGVNPGANHVRMALVADEADCLEAAHRIARFMQQHPFS